MNSQASAHIQLCGSRDDIAGLLAGSEFKSTPTRRARQARGDDSRAFWQRVHKSWGISPRVRGVAKREDIRTVRVDSLHSLRGGELRHHRHHRTGVSSERQCSREARALYFKFLFLALGRKIIVRLFDYAHN